MPSELHSLLKYPKLENNVIFAVVFPRPPEKEKAFSAPIPFGELNLSPGTVELLNAKPIVAHHSAQNFTRFYGSIWCDRKIDVGFFFSNDEVAPDGSAIREEYADDKKTLTFSNLPDLDYDAEALRVSYDPAKQAANGRFLVTIYGRWLKIELKNVDTKPIENIRFFVRGSVF